MATSGIQEDLRGVYVSSSVDAGIRADVALGGLPEGWWRTDTGGELETWPASAPINSPCC